MSGQTVDPALAERRVLVERAMAAQTHARGVVVDRVPVDDFAGVVVRPEAPRSPLTVLYFHGGGFRLGSVRAWTPYLTRFAHAAGVEVVAVDYSLAPEQCYPTAVEEARTAYRWATGRGAPVVLAGDSAGGNLAAGLALDAGRGDLPAHAATILLSPWLDLTVTNRSYGDNAATDAMFSRAAAEEASRMYAGGRDTADPAISPGLGDWAGQPPLFLEASSTEVLRDDARHLAAAAVAAGVQVWFREFPRQPHDWHIIDPAPPATVESLRAVGAFLDTVADGVAGRG
jgi:monoterpene epsilon-lactone hydrolase